MRSDDPSRKRRKKGETKSQPEESAVVSSEDEEDGEVGGKGAVFVANDEVKRIGFKNYNELVVRKLDEQGNALEGEGSAEHFKILVDNIK